MSYCPRCRFPLTRRGLGGGAAMLLMLFAAAMGGLMGWGVTKVIDGRDGGGGNGNPPARSHNQWSHRELFDHLKARGLNVQMTESKLPGMAYLFLDAPAAEDLRAATWNADLLEGVPKHGIAAQLHPSEQVARDAAGLLGDRGFAWGRFVLRGPEPNLSRVRKALP